MNVLIFVIAMLMVLSVLTYGRVESFRHFAIIQSEFENYMTTMSRKDVNDLSTYRYTHTHVPSRYRGSNPTPNPASSTLSFNLFIDKKERDQNSRDLEVMRNAAKNMMHYLYGSQPFFKKIEENRPQLLDEIIDGLIEKTKDLTDKEKPKRPVELATIDFGNDDLNTAFTYMLEGLQGPNGYPPLLDYITIQKKKLVIRVFLAYRPVLVALFGNTDIVNQIIATRYRLFLDVNNKHKTAPEASNELKSLFLSHKLPFVPDSSLDFSVSGTNPSKYIN